MSAPKFGRAIRSVPARALAGDPDHLATTGLRLYTYFAHRKTAGVAVPFHFFRFSAFPLLAGSPDQAGGADDCFRQAIETARRQQSKAWELRATMSLARLWQRQDRRDDARAALAAIYGTSIEGFTTPDLVDAAALLEALVDSPATKPSKVAGRT